MKYFKPKKNFLAILAVPPLAVFGFFPVAAISDNEAGARMLDEIIVTARKAEESLQDVPVTVSVVNSETIERYRLDKVEKLTSRTPNLNITTGGTGSGGRVDLRGVGSSQLSPAFDQAVAFEIDGAMVSTGRIVTGPFLDVEQISVLKGPQALYFGKSASAGVISIKSAGPTEEFEAGLKASYEFEEDGQLYEAFISGPLTDTLGGRLVVQYMDTDEMIENADPTAVNQEKGEENLAGRLTLFWEPTERFTAETKVYLGRYENDGPNQFLQHNCVDGSPQAINWGGVIRPAFYDCDIDHNEYYLPDGSPVETANFPRSNNGVPYTEMDTVLASLDLNYDLTDSLSLTSVTSFFELEDNNYENFLFAAGGGATQAALNRVENIAQEFRIQSDFRGMWDFMAGVYYQENELENDFSSNPASIALVLDSLGAPPEDIFTGYTHDYRAIQNSEGDVTSFFGSVQFRPAERWDVTAGLRWTREEKTSEIFVPYSHYVTAGVVWVPTGFQSDDIEFTDENWSPEVSVVYTLNDKVNLFAAYKTGFKSGGIDIALPSITLAAPGGTDGLIYESEESEGFEVGIKSTLADGSLRLNATAYNYVYENLQQQSFDVAAIQYRLFNVGEATTRGVEIDLDWVTPVEGLNVYAALAYTDAFYSDEFINQSGVDLEDRDLVGNSEWAGNAGFDYSVPIGNSGLSYSFSANAAYKSEYHTADIEPNIYIQDGYWLVDLATSIGADEGSWQVSLIGNNIFDEKYTSFMLLRNGVVTGPSGLADQMLFQNRGRQVSLEAKMRF